MIQQQRSQALDHRERIDPRKPGLPCDGDQVSSHSRPYERDTRRPICGMSTIVIPARLRIHPKYIEPAHSPEGG